MASSKVLMFLIFFALAIAATRADEEAGAINVDISRYEVFDALKLEIEQLKSRISSLESTRLEKVRELKSNDEKISQLESVIQKKAASVVSLRKEVELFQQKKGAVDATELVGNVHARSNELEKKVEELQNQIEMQNRKRHALESQTIEAEKKVHELDLTSRSLEKMNDEQNQKIQKAERALQIAEEELVRAQLEATSKLQELNEVHRAWLPPWLAYRIVRSQEIVRTNWKKHGKPALGVLVLKVSEKFGQAHKWVEPHLETAKAKWIPVAKARWIVFTTTVRPHMEKASIKAVEIFELCRTTVKPHISAFQEFTQPFVQEARTFAKPYVELAATISKPYVDKASAVLKPYTGTVIDGYRELLETTGTYHHQVSAALVLPVFLIYKMPSKLLGKKVVKPVRSTRSHNQHRRHKRRHADQ